MAVAVAEAEAERKSYTDEGSDASDAKSRIQRGQDDPASAFDRDAERHSDETDAAYSEYATDENVDITDRMQLNPSADFYDDYEDHDDDDGLYDSDEESSQSAPGFVARDQVQDEEVDMGYDEDDERIAITGERPKDLTAQQHPQVQHSIGEGSAGSNLGTKIYGRSGLSGSVGFAVNTDNVYQRNGQSSWTANNGRGDEVDSREGSGNFANDDEEDEDDEDDDDHDDDDEEHGSDEHSRSRGDFFNSKRGKSSSRYFRKNNNDAIKIISTPLGKVGIVYQQSPLDHDQTMSKVENSEKKSTSFTDFDALSPDPDSSRRLASSHPKITPVLTPDGKVALLYRGDSEVSKYEPIRNLTHKFNNKNNSSSDPQVAATNEEPADDNEPKDSDAEDSEERSDRNDNDERLDRGQTADNKHVFDEQRTDSANNPSATGTFALRPPDSILPIINRPLSEVLGIKKNQFKQFRVKDTLSTTTESTPRQLTGAGDSNTDSNLHLLTKVNLADYPTSSRSRNFDFDFSRDHTMLDERRRHQDVERDHQQHADGLDVTSHSNTMAANEDDLSKTEVVNLAIVPHFDEELERLKRLRDHENRRHHRLRHRQRQTEEDLSGIHCIMQAMMGIAAISTVFGMLGTFFKQRILDQIRLMHHW